MADPNPKPTSADLAGLIQRLIELRDALQATALALSDYQYTLDSEQRRQAEQQAKQWIERARSRDYFAGDGFDGGK